MTESGMTQTKTWERQDVLNLVAGWGGLTVLWLLLIHQLGAQWSAFQQYSYGWTVPMLAGYLLWERWLDRPPARQVSQGSPWLSWLFVAACFVFVAVRFVHEADPIWRLSSWALALLAVFASWTALWCLGGRSWWLHFGFAVFFFLVAVPWPQFLDNLVIQTLTKINTAVVVEMLGFLGIPAVQQGNLIQISKGVVGVDEACSGIRSFQGTLMISLFLGELYRFKPMERLILLLSGVFTAFGLNVVRTFFLVWISNKDGLEALDKWHDSAGMTILVISFVLLWGLAAWVKSPSEPTQSEEKESLQDTTPWNQLFPLAARPGWLALGILIAGEAGIEAWYRLHEVRPKAGEQWTIRWPSEARDFAKYEIPEVSAEILQQDAGASAQWRSEDGTRWQAFYLEWRPGRGLESRIKVEMAKVHRPDVCLPASGLTLREDFGIREIPAGSWTLPFRVYRFENGQKRPAWVFFCVWEDLQSQTRQETYKQYAARFRRVEDALKGRRGLGQRSLEFIIEGPADLEQALKTVEANLEQLLQPDARTLED